MENIRILAFAPYEGLKKLIEEIGPGISNCTITTYMGDLEEAVNKLSELDQNQFDVILSRGGTAEMLQKATDLPVINMHFAFADILGAMNLAKNSGGKYAFIGYPTLCETTEKITRFMDLDFDIYPISNSKEVNQAIDEMIKKDYDMIIADTLSSKIATKRGINNILLVSGRDTVTKAIEESVSIGNFRKTINMKTGILEEALSVDHNYIVVFDKEGNLLYKPKAAGKTESLVKMTSSLIPTFLDKKIIHSFRKLNGRNICIEGRVMKSGNYCFYVDNSERLYEIQESGIERCSIDDVEQDLINILFNMKCMYDIKNNLEGLSKFRLPILVTGETGTGKATVSDALYANSRLSSTLYYKFYCKEMDEKSWNYLLGRYQSPLNSTNQTLCFNSLDVLSPVKFRELLIFLKESPVLKSNQVIITWNTDNKEAANMLQALKEELGMSEIRVTPLRESIEELPRLISLFIDQINRQTGNQTSGIVQEGIKLMMDHTWPGNITELRNVLMSLTSRTLNSFVSYDTVRAVLEKSSYSEKKFVPGVPSGSDIDIDQTLDNIIYDIVTKKMKDSPVTQSDLAKDLGISRTTLWRILKNGKTE